MATTTPRAPAREIFGWAMFDFANSSYTTVIVTVVFSVIFPRLVVGDGPEFRQGNLLWSVALSVSYGLVVLTAPVLGAIIDFRAAKKRFLFASYLLTVVATALLYFVGPGQVLLGVVLVVVSNYGFAVGESFTSSFLPDLGPTEELGKISGYAWGLGYVGGIACTALVLGVVGAQTLENFERVRLVGPITAIFFLVAAIPTFMFLRERGTAKTLAPGETLLAMGVRRLVETARALGGFRDLLVFFVSFFFAMAGLSIVIAFAFIYGDQIIRWSPKSQILMFVITNLTASVGAVGFGFLQKRWGNLRTFNLTLGIWVAAIVGIWGTPGSHHVAERGARHGLVGRVGVPVHGRDGRVVPRCDAVREPDHRGGVQSRIEVRGVLRVLGAVRQARRDLRVAVARRPAGPPGPAAGHPALLAVLPGGTGADALRARGARPRRRRRVWRPRVGGGKPAAGVRPGSDPGRLAWWRFLLHPLAERTAETATRCRRHPATRGIGGTSIPSRPASGLQQRVREPRSRCTAAPERA